jgi:hypothetical protein
MKLSHAPDSRLPNASLFWGAGAKCGANIATHQTSRQLSFPGLQQSQKGSGLRKPSWKEVPTPHVHVCERFDVSWYKEGWQLPLLAGTGQTRMQEKVLWCLAAVSGNEGASRQVFCGLNKCHLARHDAFESTEAGLLSSVKNFKLSSCQALLQISQSKLPTHECQLLVGFSRAALHFLRPPPSDLCEMITTRLCARSAPHFSCQCILYYDSIWGHTLRTSVTK